MTANEIVVTVAEALAAEGVPYMLVGAFSVGVYGVPRATKDADFVIQLRADELPAVVDRLGSDFQLDPQMSFETVTGTTRHILRSLHSGFVVELFRLSNDPHDIERFSRKRKGLLLGKEVYYPAAEDVLITKLRWSRQGQRAKDIDDVRNLLAVQGDNLDWDYVHRWCDAHGTRGLLDELRRSLPKM